ncbi:Hydroxynaphthalene reductase arp2 like protein [Verticillium longisporum]|uniref:Hydroxynaphthalene reductase arp2 like protein n=1 Tax=Verticillium longisporum TaxID=100787 RepID=A0A8I2Z164_VERLO|nr:Hydroxynaphthalene reductase arp2 like protein [Verticillium longisporum]
MDFETESLVSQPSQEGLILQKRHRHSIISDVPSFRFSREPSLSLNWTKPLPQIPPADMTLSGKIVLVAGGARGIGAAVTLRLAQDGARIAFTFDHATSVSRAHAVIASVEAAGSSATAIQADPVKDHDRVVRHVLKAFQVSHIDILINGPGAELAAPLETTSPEAFDRVFESNARAVFFMMKAVRPYLAREARVVNLSGSAARGDDVGSMALAGSRAAVEAFTRVAAREFGEMGRGITVNCVSPGMVKDGDEDGASEDLGLETARGTPAGERLGNVDDIADVVAFLVSEGARWVTGAVVPVNGGRMMF